MNRAGALRRWRVWLAPLLCGAALAGLPLAASAQQAPVAGVQGEGTAQALDAALAQLARNPRDIDALIAAGRAALALGDTDAATGFFSRADRLSPGMPRVQAGLAVAKVRARDPLAALPLFATADAGHALTPDDITDRGLAFDLVGDNPSAQRYYRQALTGGAGGEATRRLVLSLAIAGDYAGSEAAVGPLLDRQDRAAARTHAFALAILGHEDEAVAMVQRTMPPELAAAIAPYLRYMRKLTPAQQAAAANLGEFPHAADIGQDDPRIVRYAAEHQLRRLASAEAVTVGELMLTRAKPRPAERQRRKPRVADAALGASAANPLPPEPTPSRDTSSGELPALASPAVAASPRPRPAQVVPPRPASQPAPLSPAPAAAPSGAIRAPGQVAASPVASPGLTLNTTRAAAPPAIAPATSVPAVVAPSAAPFSQPVAPASVAAPPAAAAPRRLSFAEAFGNFGAVAPGATPSVGAVDIRKINPARPAPKAPPPPSHPSRIWVELGVGRDTDRLGFDWHRMNRDDPELFQKHKPSVTGWARTNRLLTGPFDTQEAADAYVEKLRKAGHDGVFVWTSPAGQVVDPLDAK